LAESKVESLRADVNGAFATYSGELKQAGPHWERKPAGEHFGEDAWNSRQVAEHIAGASGFFGSRIGRAIGAVAATPAGNALESCAAAVAATEVAHAGLMDVLNQAKDDQLATAMNFPPLGDTTVAQVIGVVAYHYRDHANQLKTLREAQG